VKFSFKSFTIGFACAAISLGAVTYANAAGDATIKACANKKTGAMRYISKGSCKKTEKSLSWNQMGPQGSTGTNGQNFHVIDAAGRDLGIAIGIYDQGNTAIILYEGGLWSVSTASSEPDGGLRQSNFYSDSSCTTILAGVKEAVSPMARGMGVDGNNKTRYYKASGEQFMWKSRTVYSMIAEGEKFSETYSCKPSSDAGFAGLNEKTKDELVQVVTEVTPPAYTAPFTIVAK
jgi:hypothetical protein